MAGFLLLRPHNCGGRLLRRRRSDNRCGRGFAFDGLGVNACAQAEKRDSCNKKPHMTLQTIHHLGLQGTTGHYGERITVVVLGA
jgi:hypothetical protein